MNASRIVVVLAIAGLATGCAKQPNFEEADVAYEQEKHTLDAMEREFTDSAEYAQALKKVAQDLSAEQAEALKDDFNECVCRMKETDPSFAEYLEQAEPKLSAQRERVNQAWKRRSAAKK